MPLPKTDLHLQDAVDWLSSIDEQGDLEWILQGMVPKGGVCLLSGQQKRSMKTYFSIQLAISVITGMKLGGAVDVIKPGKVMVFAEEGSRFGYRDRIDAALYAHGFGRGVLQGKMSIAFRQMIKLDKTTCRESILRAADEFQPDIIIFDSLYRMVEGDENSQEDVNKVLDTLMRLGREDFASIVICHLDKTRGASEKQDIDDQVRGSGVITNGYDAHIALRRYKSSQKFIDLHVRPREAPEWHKQVVWKVERDKADKPVKAVMSIKEVMGAKGKTVYPSMPRSK